MGDWVDRLVRRALTVSEAWMHAHHGASALLVLAPIALATCGRDDDGGGAARTSPAATLPGSQRAMKQGAGAGALSPEQKRAIEEGVKTELREELRAEVVAELRRELTPVVRAELRKKLAPALAADAGARDDDGGGALDDDGGPAEPSDESEDASDLWSRPGTTIRPPRGGPKLLELEVGTALEDKLPVDVRPRYANVPEILYCYTVFENLTPEATITHVWRRGSRLVSRVELEVGTSPKWRTWSKQRTQQHWIGLWSCEVLGPDGQQLGLTVFQIGG